MRWLSLFETGDVPHCLCPFEPDDAPHLSSCRPDLKPDPNQERWSVIASQLLITPDSDVIVPLSASWLIDTNVSVR